MKSKIIAVDFDGTLCENKWPDIGEPKEEVIAYLKTRQENGDKLILWTCRTGSKLNTAVKWCREHGLIFDAVNENHPDTLAWMGSRTDTTRARGPLYKFLTGDSRKIFADEYIDDRNVLVSECREKSNMEKWAEKEVELACKREAPERKEGEWDYGCACYESALKAHKSLCGDGHSGMSIGFTTAILNRMIDGKVLTPIEDTDDVWTEYFYKKDDTERHFQCKRMSSLFKDILADGTVRYSDVNRYVGIDIGDDYGYHNRLISRIGEEMFPITMPYFPCDKPFKFYTETFLVDPKNGDSDTRGIIYVICPDGERVEINRYFKYADEGMEEIDKAEYLARKEVVGATMEE